MFMLLSCFLLVNCLTWRRGFLYQLDWIGKKYGMILRILDFLFFFCEPECPSNDMEMINPDKHFKMKELLLKHLSFMQFCRTSMKSESNASRKFHLLYKISCLSMPCSSLVPFVVTTMVCLMHVHLIYPGNHYLSLNKRPKSFNRD